MEELKYIRKFGTAVTGDSVYSCAGFLTSIDYSADSEQPVTYSGTFVSSGTVTIATKIHKFLNYN